MKIAIRNGKGTKYQPSVKSNNRGDKLKRSISAIVLSSLFFLPSLNAQVNAQGIETSSITLFQGPWNVHAQRGNIFKAYGRSGGESSLSPRLKGVMATLRAKYGKGAVSGVGGARSGDVAGRPGMPSCHNGGHAFDAHLSAAARRHVMGDRSLGVITYSGRMTHVHVSDCARERGYRGHKRS